MDKSTMMNREEFVYHMYSELTNFFGLGVVRQDGDDFHYKIKLKNNNEIGIYLGNVWENYVRSDGDTGFIESFLSTQDEIARMATRTERVDVDTDSIVPVLRHSSYMTGVPTEHGTAKATPFIEEFTDELTVFYAEDGDKMFKFLTKELIPKGMTEDECVKKAFDNMKKRGWVEERAKRELEKGTELSIYRDPNQTFHAQFIIREMFEPKIGSSFYVSFPSRDTALVMVLDENIIKAGSPEFIKVISFMKEMSVDFYEKHASPLSPVIHQIGKGSAKVVI